MSKNVKMIVCRNCNTPMAAKLKQCPVCGEKNKKPFYKRWWFILLIILLVVIIIGSITNGNTKENADSKQEYRWPDSVLAKMIPQPKSVYGKILYESEERFSIDIYAVTETQFEEYIDECKNSGFTVDYTRFDDSYSADNTDGFSLRLNYNKEAEQMDIYLNAPDGERKAEETTSKDEKKEENQSNIDKEAEDISGVQENTLDDTRKISDQNTTANQTMEADQNTSELVDGMRPEFKDAMDSYEVFFNEYCDFMKAYRESTDTVGMLAEYTDYMGKYVDAMEKLDKIGEEEMNNAELKYYTEVMGRINQKLLSIAE